MIYTAFYQAPAPIGKILAAATENALIGLWMEGQKYDKYTLKNQTHIEQTTPVLQQTRHWLDRYFNGEKPAITGLNLAPVGSPFAKEVWQILCDIPYGSVTTYGAIAKQLAHQQGRARISAQAVGGAVAHNQISIIIPCHRVIGANGSLTGYAGGMDKKIYLLQSEGVNVNNFFIPEYNTAP